MFKRIKKIKKLKQSKAMKEAVEFDYDKEGRVQINVGLQEAEDFFAPFSYKSYEFMNNDVNDYINKCEASIPIKEEISLDIYTETPTTNEEKQRIKRTVKRHHAEEIVRINTKLRRNLTEGIVFSVIGCIILLLEAILYTKITNLYLDTLLAVVGWLFLWDGLEVMLSDRSELKRKKIRSFRLMNAKVHVRKYSKKIQKEYNFGDYEENDD